MSDSSRRAASLGLVFALVVVAGSACSTSDPAPTPSVTTASARLSLSPSPSSASPSPNGSYSVPSEAREQTDAGAIAFVQYYFEQANLAWTQPDDSLLPPLFEPGCQSCQAIQQGAVTLVRNHQRYRSEPIKVGTITVEIPAASGQAVVKTGFDQGAVEIVDSSGNVVAMSESAKGQYEIAVIWREGKWLVYGMA